MKAIFTFLILSHTMIGQTWLQIADFPDLARDDGVAVTVNNKAFFGTGLRVGFSLGNEFYSLDPVYNSWSSIASLPSGAERQYACAFAGSNCFFVFSGAGPSGPLNDLYRYDLAAGTWSLMAPKPGNGLQGATCFEFGDKIIIAGGKLGNGPATDEVWEYTISTNSWLQKNNCPFGGRFRAGAAVLNHVGYQIFGLDKNNLYRKELYSYDPTGDSWAKILDFPQAHGRAYVALKAINSKLILFGGLDSLNTYYKDIWYFDPVTTSWSQSSDFVSFGRKGGMSVVVNTRFYYSCGIDVTDTRLKESWMLDVPLGIEASQNIPVLSIYPNPCKGEFILTASGGSEIYIIDGMGQHVLHLTLSNNNRELSFNGVANGIYFVILKKKNGDKVTTKLIVDR